MNKAYRTVWSKARSAFIVVHEKASGRGKQSSRGAALAIGVAASLGLSPALAANICGNGPNQINTVQASADSCSISNGASVEVGSGGAISTAGGPAINATGNVGSIVNAGTVNSSTDYVAMYLDSATVSGDVINRGTLTSVPNGGWSVNGAFYASGSQISGSVINDGGHVNNNIALHSSDVTNLQNINGGNISVSGNQLFGFYLSGTTVRGGILNDATSTISTSGFGAVNIYGGSVGSGGIVNRGMFDKGGISLNGGVIVNGDVINYGTIQNAMGGGAFYMSGAGSKVTGNVRNDGRITNSVYGFLVYTNSVIQGSITNTGTIQANSMGIWVGDRASVGAGIINSGSITATGGGIMIDGSGSVTGGIRNTGPISSDTFGLRVNNGSLTAGADNIAFYNNNQITSTNNGGNRQTIWFSNAAQVTGNIVNDNGGVIGGGDYGFNITNASQINGSIFNSGTIGGGRYALYVSDDSRLSKIYAVGNQTRFSGDVYATGTDFVVSSGATFTAENAYNVKSFTVSSGAQVNLTNGGSTGGMAGGITVGSNGFNNAGSVNVNAGARAVIHGNFTQAASGTLRVGANGGAPAILFIDQAAVNAGAVTLASGAALRSASFANNGTFGMGNDSTLVTTGGVVNNGAFTMGNGSTVGAASGFTNNGVVTLGSGVNATVTGNYVQGGTGVLRVGVADNTTYAKLAVSGTAALPSNAKIDVDVTRRDYQFTAERLSNVIKAGTLVSDGTFQVTSNSALFNFGAVKDGNAVHLTMTPAAVTGGPTVLDSVTEAGNRPGMGAASVLDRIIGSDPQGGIAAHFVSLTSKQAVSRAVSQTLPLLNGGGIAAASSSISSISRVVQARIEANRGLSSGDEFLGDKYVWLKPFGSWSRQSDQDGIAGFKANTKGFVLGVDAAANDRMRLGLGLAYANSSVNGNSDVTTQHMDVDVFQLLGYGSYSIDGSTELNFQADVGQNRNKGSRGIGFANTTATADYRSLTAHASVGLGRVMAISEKTNLTPSIRLDYSWIRDGAYTENGAGVLNLNVNGRIAREMTLGVDGKLNHAIDEATMFTANIGGGYDMLNEKATIVAAYAGAPGAAFATYGMDKTPWSVRGGLGVMRKIGSGTEITARYDAEGRTGFINQTVSLKARWMF